MKPKSIQRFDRIFAIALALWLFHQFVIIDGLVDPGIALATAPDLEGSIWIGVNLILSFGLWYLISRKAKSGAQLAFIVLTVFAVITNGWIASDNWGVVPLDSALLAAVIVLDIAQIVLLTRPDSVRWLYGGTTSDA